MYVKRPLNCDIFWLAISIFTYIVKVIFSKCSSMVPIYSEISGFYVYVEQYAYTSLVYGSCSSLYHDSLSYGLPCMCFDWSCHTIDIKFSITFVLQNFNMGFSKIIRSILIVLVLGKGKFERDGWKWLFFTMLIFCRRRALRDTGNNIYSYSKA